MDQKLKLIKSMVALYRDSAADRRAENEDEPLKSVRDYRDGYADAMESAAKYLEAIIEDIK